MFVVYIVVRSSNSNVKFKNDGPIPKLLLKPIWMSNSKIDGAIPKLPLKPIWMKVGEYNSNVKFKNWWCHSQITSQTHMNES